MGGGYRRDASRTQGSHLPFLIFSEESRIDTLEIFWHSKDPMKHLFSLLLVAVLITGFTGCNTISGAGKDVSAAGQDLTKVANKTQEKINNN
jgi:predicted small secreted protein